MKYTEFMGYASRMLQENRSYYGDFGFEYRFEWEGRSVSGVEVTWSGVNSCYVDDAYRFAEALGAACFDGAKLVGMFVED